MSVYIQEIDLNLLIYGLEQYTDDISQESLEQLQTAIVSVQQSEPNSKEALVSLVSQDDSLDRLYTKSLKARTQGYITQERTKSLVLNLNPTLQTEICDAVDQLARTIAQILTRRETQTLTQATQQVLRTLEKSHLTTQDLTYSLNRTQEQTQAILQVLWQKGYIDRLTASLPHILFPGLRPNLYRTQLPSPDTLLTLTAKGYFHLYPLVKRTDRMNIA